MSHKTEIRMYRTVADSGWLNIIPSACKLFFQKGPSIEPVPVSLTPIGSSTEQAYTVDDMERLDASEGIISVSQSFSLSQLQRLFVHDKGRQAVALPGDRLGVAAIWWIDSVGIRGCEIVGDFTYDDIRKDGVRRFNFQKSFDVGMVAGRMEISYIIYMKEPGMKRQPGIASQPGIRLATLGVPVCLLFDGNSSQFPIVTTSQPGESLWWVDFNIDDPLTDLFSEDYISIILNEAHEDFSALGQKNGYNTPLYAEVFATALEEIFLYMHNEFSNDFQNLDLRSVQPGTIAFAILYMKSTFNLQTDTLDHLHRSIRQMVTHGIKGGTVQ